MVVPPNSRWTNQLDNEWETTSVYTATGLQGRARHNDPMLAPWPVISADDWSVAGLEARVSIHTTGLSIHHGSALGCSSQRDPNAIAR